MQLSYSSVESCLWSFVGKKYFLIEICQIRLSKFSKIVFNFFSVSQDHYEIPFLNWIL